MDEKLATLRQAFLVRTGNEAEELEALLRALENRASEECLEHIRSIAHRIAGSAGIFGLGNLTAPALAVEDGIVDRCAGTEIRARAMALVTEIRRSVKRQTEQGAPGGAAPDSKGGR